MTRPLEPLTMRLSPPRNCAEGHHTGQHVESTPRGVHYRCRRCPYTWHVDAANRLIGRTSP